MKQIDVVGAVIINDQDEVLCALRSKEMSLPGLWEFPGGKIEPGENPQEALVREIKEELLCDIEVGELIADIFHEYPTIRIRLITYYAKIRLGIPTAIEHEKLTWITRPELKQLKWAPADVPTVKIVSGE